MSTAAPRAPPNVVSSTSSMSLLPPPPVASLQQPPTGARKRPPRRGSAARSRAAREGRPARTWRQRPGCSLARAAVDIVEGSPDARARDEIDAGSACAVDWRYRQHGEHGSTQKHACGNDRRPRAGHLFGEPGQPPSRQNWLPGRRQTPASRRGCSAGLSPVASLPTPAAPQPTDAARIRGRPLLAVLPGQKTGSARRGPLVNALICRDARGGVSLETVSHRPFDYRT